MRENKLKTLAKRAAHKFSHQSLFVKYFTVFSLMVFTCFLVLGLTLGVFVINYWTNQKTVLLKENAKNTATSTAEVLGSWLRDNPQGSVVFICNNLATVSEAIDADVFMCDPNGKVILCKELLSNGYEVAEGGRCNIHDTYRVPQEILQKVNDKGYYERGKLGDMFNTTQLTAIEPVRVNGQIAGYVLAVEPISINFKGYVLDVIRMFLFASLMALAIGFIIIYLFTVNLIHPLKEMSKATKAYATGDFSPRVAVSGSDELAELTSAFNRMASALATQESSRRNFVANVSHELKTPMTTIGGFIDGKIMDSAIVGVLCYVGCSALRIPNALLVSVLVGVTNIIPFFGPVIGAVPATLLILIESPMKALWFVIFVLVLQQLDGNVIGPKILGNRTGLSGFWVMFAIILFGGLWGIVGMIICVPLFAVIYDTVRRLVIRGLRKKDHMELWEEYRSAFPDTDEVKK